MNRKIKKMILITVSFIALMLAASIAGILTLFPVVRLHAWAVLGDSNAMMKLGDLTREIHWYRDACEAGNPWGCHAIWSFSERRNPQEAFDYLKKGAALELKQRKSYECLLELSRVHEYGLLGQPRNHDEASKVTKQWAEIQRELRATGMVL